MKRKSYSETHGEWVYDWPQILDDLEAGLYNNEQRREVVGAANNWVTCACGNQCDALPRDGDGWPRDYTLAKLGMDFYMHVGDAAFFIDNVAPRVVAVHRARQTLALIELRAAELLREMGK